MFVDVGYDHNYNHAESQCLCVSVCVWEWASFNNLLNKAEKIKIRNFFSNYHTINFRIFVRFEIENKTTTCETNKLLFEKQKQPVAVIDPCMNECMRSRLRKKNFNHHIEKEWALCFRNASFIFNRHFHNSHRLISGANVLRWWELF